MLSQTEKMSGEMCYEEVDQSPTLSIQLFSYMPKDKFPVSHAQLDLSVEFQVEADYCGGSASSSCYGAESWLSSWGG